MIKKRVGDLKYEIQDMIGKGSFGEVYRGVNIETGVDVAIKMESVDISQHLKDEYAIYKLIGKEVGFPNIYHFAKEENYTILIMELLGLSLQELFYFCFKKFSMKTVLMIADQMIGNIATLHSKGILHRDVKPDNFLIGYRNHSQRIYLIDFGLSYPYLENNHKRHLQYEENMKFVGTARFASLNTHLGLKQSRRDDLESIGYCLMYFLIGKLPWQGRTSRTKRQMCEKIMEIKLSIRIEELCKGFPNQFSIYLDYCRKLQYNETPNYKYLQRLFHNLLKSLNHKCDFVYDWKILKFEMYQNQKNRAILSRFPEGKCERPKRKSENWFELQKQKECRSTNAIILRYQRVNRRCPNKKEESVQSGELILQDYKYFDADYSHHLYR